MVPGKPIYHTVFNEYKMIFTLIPKNANTSIKYALIESFLNLDKTELDNLKKLELDRFHASTLKFFNFITNVELDRFDEYKKICVVRNPFDRLLSGWENKIKNLGNKTRFGFKGATSFPNFITTICSMDDELINRHFTPQINFLKCGNKVISFDIMKYEFLEDEWKNLQTFFKLNFNTILSDLPKLNMFVSDKEYREYYTSTLQKLVEDKFAEDLETFNYEF